MTRYIEQGQVALSELLSEVLRPKFGLRTELDLAMKIFGLRIFLDRIWVLARC